MVFLVDANVLIAMSDGEHVHHDRAVEWFAGVESFATCPITEGALVRYLVREGTNPSLIRQALVTLASRPGHEFWADSLPYAEADLTDVIGHRQVTDAYLASLARKHGNDARLATLDLALVSTHPDVAVLVA